MRMNINVILNFFKHVKRRNDEIDKILMFNLLSKVNYILVEYHIYIYRKRKQNKSQS